MQTLPKQVLLVNDAAHINGGQGKVMVESALGLKARGFDVHIYAGIGPVDDDVQAAGIPVHGMISHDVAEDPNRARAVVRGIWNSPVAADFAETLSKFEASSTIVHIHGWAKTMSGSIAKVLHESGLPTVYTMHEYSLACPNTAFLDYRKNEICERKALGISCLTANCDHRPYPQKLWRVARQLGMRAGGWPRNLQHVIYLSDVQKHVMEPYLAERTMLHHLPNPIAIPKDEPAPVAQNNRFVFVGRLSPEKGPFLFAEAARKAGVQACFVGDGPLAEELQTAYPECEFRGWQDKQGVRQAMQQARAVVMSSLCYETHGMSVYEALASGVPVIVGDRSAAREAVKPGHNGVLFPMANVEGLAEAMRELTDADKAARMGANAHYDYWAKPLDLTHHVDGLLGIYGKVLQG